MHIAIDGGAFCSPQQHHFGTYTCSYNLLKALALYDTKNTYDLYTFCDVELSLPSHIQIKKLLPATGWMKLRVSLEELLRPKDVFLAFNQSLPLYTRAKKIVFSHGLSFLAFKGHYQEDYGRLKKQLERYVHQADSIVVSSIKVKDELEYHYVCLPRIEVLPFGLPFEFIESQPSEREPYFIFVGSNQAIKQVNVIVDMFQKFVTKKEYKHFKLILVGPHTQYESAVINVLPHCEAYELKKLYQKASGYLAISLYESFNFPILEALSQDCPVIGFDSAIIPEMKELVYIAKDREQFENYMEKVAEGKVKKVDRGRLLTQFSWKTYVEKLVSLYK
jgi:glycosyltransferase involved in cell wall biosynthesis